MEEGMIPLIRKEMSRKNSAELLQILEEYDTEEYTLEAFEAIRQVLKERNINPPDLPLSSASKELLKRDECLDNEEKRIKEVKSRHGCLMAWLILIIIMNSAVALMYLINPLRRGMISQILPNVPVWVSIVSIVISIFIVVCAIALLLWKKWGFWGICATSVVSLIVNLSVGSSGIGQVLFSVFNCLLGVVLLFGVLHIGKKENKGWPQLK